MYRWMDKRPSAERCLGFFHFFFFNVVNSTTVKIHIRVFVWTEVLISLGQVPRAML